MTKMKHLGAAMVMAAVIAPAAHAGRSCEAAKPPSPQVMERGMALAQQTADLLCEALGFTGQRQTVTWLTPESELRQTLRELADFALDELLLVTHQPLVGSLAGLLIHGHRQQPLPMNTASLALLEGEELLAGLMELSLYQHPA